MSVTFFHPGMNANGQPETDPSAPPPPAAPFPQEPGDMPAGQPEPAQQPPEPQQGDPGAEPPPAGLEQMPDPLQEVIERVAAASRADRQSINVLTQAFINQVAATVGTVRLTRDSIARMGPDDVYPLVLLKELHEEAEALTIMLLPFADSRRAAVN
jgi:hypothetical protein